jgi:predicted permease
MGAGLFLRTLANLRQVDVGFNPKNLVLFSVNPRLNGYDAPRIARLYADMRHALRDVPGVRSVSLSQSALLAGNINQGRLYIQGKDGYVRNWAMTVSPEFFDTMQIPLVRGRTFDTRDAQPKAAPVSIINEEAARQYFPGEDPIGRRWGGSRETAGEVEIVGILHDTKYASVRDAAPPTAYTPFVEQSSRGATFEVRTAGDPMAAIPQVREAIRRVDPTVLLERVSTQAEQIEGRFNNERLFARSYTLFGALALVLASVGLFGLMSYSVSRRTAEIGIRMALGAQQRAVIGMVLRESTVLVAIGVAIGIGVAFAAGRLVAALLFAVAPTDVATAALSVATLVAVSTIAGYLPARRASKVDPLVALRLD